MIMGLLGYFALPSSLDHPFVWIALGLVLLSLSSCYSLMIGDSPKQSSFWSGFALGSGAWLYSPMLFFSPMIIQAGFSSGTLNLRRLLIHIIGFSLPTYLILTCWFIIKSDLIFPIWFTKDWEMIDLSKLDYFFIGHVLFAFVFLFVSTSISLKSCTIREKRKYYLVVSMLFFAVIASLFNDAEIWFSLSLIPLSLFLSRIFQFLENRWIREMIFLCYLLLIVGLNI